jgi:WD40 repeat protein
MFPAELPGIVRSLAFTADEKELVTASREITIWNVASAQKVYKLPYSHPLALAFTSDGKTLAMSDGVGAKFWDMVTKRETKSILLRDADASSAAFSPNLKKLAVLRPARIVEVWNLEDRKVEKTFPGAEACLFSPDAANLALIRTDGTVSLLDLNSGRVASLLERVRDETRRYAMSFSPDGETLVIGGNTGRVHICNVKTGREAGLVQLGNEYTISSLALSKSDDAFRLVIAQYKATRPVSAAEIIRLDIDKSGSHFTKRWVFPLNAARDVPAKH